MRISDWSSTVCSSDLVNPNLGLSVDEAFLERELMKADRDGVEQMLLIASQHFNVQVGLRLRNDRWRGADLWELQGDKALTLEHLIGRSEVAVVGIDGGGLDDLFGLCVAGRCKATKDWLYWSHAWAQRDVLELRKEVAKNLQDFEAQGDLTFCEDRKSTSLNSSHYCATRPPTIA